MSVSGACLCGGVRFEVEGDVEPTTFCHCTSCKKLSGGAGTANARVRSDAIQIVAGAELVRTYQPGEGVAKTFCVRCGSNLFGGGWPKSEFSSVRLPAFEAPLNGAPKRHLFVRSVASWETLPDDGLERVDASG